MELRQKILVNAVIPLAIALCAIALAVHHYATSLAEQERKVIGPAYLATKDAELKNYVAIARRAISHLYESGRTDEGVKNEAKTILESLKYGEDGYFFLYDHKGMMLVHPHLQQWVGKNMLDYEDKKGKLIIQDLIRTALEKEEGGFEDYYWEKYSSGSDDPKPKRAYVVNLPAWGWMLGTGVYLDDVDNALAQIGLKVATNINKTMLWIASIAVLVSVAIFVGLTRNIRERTALDDRLGEANDRLNEANIELQAQAQRVLDAQAEERKNMGEALHGTIQQKLVSIKLNIETALETQPKAHTATVEAQVEKFASLPKSLREVMTELRKIIDGIPVDPDFDLVNFLNSLTQSMSSDKTPIDFRVIGRIPVLTSPIQKTLKQIAEDALTNIVKHAEAKKGFVQLEGGCDYIKLEIYDDGKGFDVNSFLDNPGLHRGLCYMRARARCVGGRLEPMSSANGTRVIVTIPI